MPGGAQPILGTFTRVLLSYCLKKAHFPDNKKVGFASPWYFPLKPDVTFVLRVSSVFKRQYVISVESYLLCEYYWLYMANIHLLYF